MPDDQSAATALAPASLSIDGMTCAGCVKAVTRALSAVPGVTGVDVDLALARAQIVGTAPMARLVAAVEQAGFDARAA